MKTIIDEVEKIFRENGIEEAQAEAKLLVCEISEQRIEDILLGCEIKNKEKIFELAQKRIETKAPIQHIIGYSYFMGQKYVVNENVLIPRDETEILVEEAYKLLKNKTEKIHILEIGCGTGCISCALAHKLKDKDIEILSTDISLEAIEVALENINKQDLVRKIIFRKSDIYSKIRDIERFDLIISNPPYIPIQEKENLQNEVKNFEPELALFAPDKEGIIFYQKIIDGAPEFLKEGGAVAFELGINQSKLVKMLLEKDFRDIEIVKDLAQIDRVIYAVKK